MSIPRRKNDFGGSFERDQSFFIEEKREGGHNIWLKKLQKQELEKKLVSCTSSTRTETFQEQEWHAVDQAVANGLDQKKWLKLVFDANRVFSTS